MPTLQEFLTAAKPQNPGVSDAELTNYYSRTYAEQPAVTASPTLQEFLTAAKPKNPGVADSALTDYYNRTYAKPSTEPTEYGGFFGSAGTALKERAATALPTAKLFTGVGNQKAATDELAKYKEDAGNAYKQVEFGDIGDAFKQGDYGGALGKTVEKFKEVAGSSLGSMAPAMGVGAAAGLAATTALGATAAATIGLPAAAVGTVAFGLTALGSYLADNISRQKEEQAKAGKPYEDINRIPAVTSATIQTALDLFGFKFFKPLGQLVGINGKEAAAGITKEIIQAATQPKAYAKAVAAGTAKGVAFEVPQEVTQTVLERWQAGLAVNPFDDPSAAKEYLEAAGGAVMLGGPFGAYSEVSKTRAARAEGARRTADAEQAAAAAQRGNKLTRDLERNPDATGLVSQPDGTGVSVAGKPPAAAPAGGATATKPSGVDVAGTNVAGTAGGEGVQPGALDQQGTTDVDETAETQQTTPQGQQTSAPDFAGGDTDADVADAKEAYDDTLTQVKSLLAMPSLTDAQKGMVGRLISDLQQIDQASLSAEEIDGVPLKDVATKRRYMPRAMQGEIFGTPKAVSRYVDMALAAAGQDPAGAIQRLRESKQRLQTQLESDGFDNNWAMKIGRSFGLNAKESLERKQDLAAEYVKRSSASIDQAIDQLTPQVKGQPKAMQGDLFASRRVREAKEGVDETAFAAPIDEELEQLPPGDKTVESETAAPATQKETVKAPDISTEHVETTGAGSLVKRFFDAVRSNSPSPDEQTKHQAVRDVARDSFLNYDITEPGQKSSPGINAAFQYLANLVGGQQGFNDLLSKLEGADAATQRALLLSRGLPDLTSRKAMDKFSTSIGKELEELPVIKALPSGTERTGVSVPTQNRAAPATGEAKGVIPHTAEVTVHTKKATAHGTTPEGKPRRPNIVEGEKKYIVEDTKLRSAWRFIKQLIANRGTPSAEALAAKNYMDNPGRETFGDVLNDLAYDLAYEEAANHTFYGEGGKYALAFQKWINENLDKGTVDTLNNLIEDQKQNRVEEDKYNAAVTEYNNKISAIKTKNAEARIQKAEKIAKIKLPRPPRISNRIGESETTEETPTVQTSRKGLPRVQMLAEVHPAILRMIRAGDLNGVLKVLAAAEGNPYYAALAERLLEANITAKTSIVKQDDMIPLSNDANVKKSLTSQLNTAVSMVNDSMPNVNQESLTRALKSENLGEVKAALAEIESKLTNESQKQTITNIRMFVNEQYDWIGKYDPESDTIMYRQGRMSNHLFLHEVIHAAALHLIDGHEGLTGVRKDAYKQLEDLYNHSKGILSLEGLNEDNTYGLINLHEFVSEAMTNPEFQYLLRGIRYKAAPFSLWNTFTRAMAKLFNVKPGYESNAMVEAMNATNILMRGTASLEGPSTKATEAMNKTIAKESKAPRALTAVPPGTQINRDTLRHLFTASSWDSVKGVLNSLSADLRPKFIGSLTLRQINDLVKNRIPQINTFVQGTEQFLAHKNNILQESGNISKTWLRMQGKDPEMSRKLAAVMHGATIAEFDPARFDPNKDKLTADTKVLVDQWKVLTPEAKKIYTQVRDFYVARYAEYQQIMMRRIMDMQKVGVTEKTIIKIREEFEKSKGKGPYFPLMRHGRFWYQAKVGKVTEFYMFESAGHKEAHIKERLSLGDNAVVSAEGSEYKTAMDLHARQSTFLKDTFQAIDNANFALKGGAAAKEILKDTLYQNFLSNQPEHSFRRQFMHRKNIEGYSKDALLNFTKSSFHMAYQLSRFKFSPDLFATMEAAKIHLKGRSNPEKNGFDVKLSRENNELRDYVTEVEKRLKLLLNPIDMGRLPSLLSNVGFIWYLTAPASAITNVVGGMMIGLPTLVGQNVRLNPDKSYMTATLEALGQMKSVAAQILGTGFSTKGGISEFFPSLNRSDTLSDIEHDAYNRFVSDGVIDITATYDQSGLAAGPTETYGGKTQKAMEILTALFHNAERFNREIVAMSAFRTAMEKRKGNTDKGAAFNESIAEAKDVTERSMFDYSVANKPRYLQESATLKVILQFKQFPQQMTYFLVHNFYNMIKGADKTTRREATARFVGTMGMAGIFSGVTGLWGFSTVANIVNAVANGLFKDEDDEEPFDFQLEFMNWAIDTFGANTGTALTRGIGNAAGIDIAGNVKLDDMWRLDSRRNNQDQVQALQSFLVNLLGPTAGLLVNAAEASNLYNEGHMDLAMEKILPAFLRGPAITYRYAQEGVLNKSGDVLMDEIGPFNLMMQSLNIRSAKLAEIQYYNITVKGQEQKVQRERQNLLNLYGLAFMSNDADTLDKVYDKIDKFNEEHPSLDIPMESLTSTIKERMRKSSETEHGLYIDKKLRGVLDSHDYTSKL